LTAKTGVGASVGKSVGAFKAVAPYKKGGIGVKFNSRAGTSYLKE
jgi:hypothetical protein